MIYPATINDGKVQFNPRQLDSINEFKKKNEGKQIWITFSEMRPPRSLMQNNYLFGVVYKYIAEETGDDVESIHKHMKERYAPRMFKEESGETIELGKSTTRLNTKEMKEYIDAIISFAGAELGIYIPQPNE